METLFNCFQKRQWNNPIHQTLPCVDIRNNQLFLDSTIYIIHTFRSFRHRKEGVKLARGYTVQKVV